MTMYNKSIL